MTISPPVSTPVIIWNAGYLKIFYMSKNALKYKKEQINDLLLSLPQDKRDESNESAIAESLKNFLKVQFQSGAEYLCHKFNRGILQ